MKDAKVAHDWGSNTITIQGGNGIIKTIILIKQLRGEVRRLKMLLCYDYQNDIIDEEEDIIFATEPKLFSLGTISLHDTIQYVKTTNVEIMDTNVKINILKQGYRVQNKKKKILDNRYELKVTFEDKVYLKNTTIINQRELQWMKF